METLFKETVGHEQEIRREEFKKIMVSKNVSLVINYSKLKRRRKKNKNSFLFGKKVFFSLESKKLLNSCESAKLVARWFGTLIWRLK